MSGQGSRTRGSRNRLFLGPSCSFHEGAATRNVRPECGSAADARGRRPPVGPRSRLGLGRGTAYVASRFPEARSPQPLFRSSPTFFVLAPRVIFTSPVPIWSGKGERQDDQNGFAEAETSGFRSLHLSQGLPRTLPQGGQARTCAVTIASRIIHGS